MQKDLGLTNQQFYNCVMMFCEYQRATKIMIEGCLTLVIADVGYVRY